MMNQQNELLSSSKLYFTHLRDQPKKGDRIALVIYPCLDIEYATIFNITRARITISVVMNGTYQYFRSPRKNSLHP